MYNNDSFIKFVSPYYANKDIMHNMWHIELVLKMVEKILSNCSYHVDRELLLLATYFHGFIYKAENEIILWMKNEGYDDIAIKKQSILLGNPKEMKYQKPLKERFCMMPIFLKEGKHIWLLRP